MVYSTENSKWKAYQFSDPFAAGSFNVCNKISKTFCRPDCDARARTNLKSEIKFVDTPRDAIDCGYTACTSCDPLSLPPIDVNFLVKCVATINKQIGFLPPLLDENEDVNNQKIKDNIIESKKSNEEQIIQAFGGRRSSVPIITCDGKFSKDFENQSLSKNDSDHYRLVDLACRHLALAAAMNIFQPQALKSPESSSEGESSDSTSAGGAKKRRRRGGVLGFKELAAKSKLSAWHFHRVFKSVTGLTPKTYGDKCWEYIKKYKDSGEPTTFANSPNTSNNAYNTPSSSNESSPIQFQVNSTQPPSKKVKLDNDGLYEEPQLNTYQLLPQDMLSMQQHTFSNLGAHQIPPPNMKYSVPQSASFDFNFQPALDSNFNIYDQEEQTELSIPIRAYSEPNLPLFGSTPTLFGHNKSTDPIFEQPLQQIDQMGLSTQTQSYTSPMTFQPKQIYDSVINSITPGLDLNQDIMDPTLQTLVGGQALNETEAEIFIDLNAQVNSLDSTIPSLVNDVIADEKQTLFDINLSPQVLSCNTVL